VSDARAGEGCDRSAVGGAKDGCLVEGGVGVLNVVCTVR
jgi:hypothetical protein